MAHKQHAPEIPGVRVKIHTLGCALLQKPKETPEPAAVSRLTGSDTDAVGLGPYSENCWSKWVSQSQFY